MSTRAKLILSATALAVLIFAGLGLAFYFTEDNLGTKSEAGATSSKSNSAPKENVSALEVSQALPAKTSTELVSPGFSVAGTTTHTSSASLDYPRREAIVEKSRTIGSASVAPTLTGSPDIDWPRIPLAFLNCGGVLPPTKEVAAAIQQIQQDFVSATGAGTANPPDPTDPNFGMRWQWAQPTADQEFYTLFGGEAYSAMLNEEIHERGHL